MSKGTSILLTLLGTAAWFWFSEWYYSCQLMQVGYGCGEEVAAVTTDSAAIAEADSKKPAINTYPLGFKWSDANPYTTAETDQYKAKIIEGKQEDNILEIVGLYFKEETTPENYENIGFARAEKVGEMFAAELPAERIKIRARMIEEQPGVRGQYFEGAAFNWMEGERKTVEKLPDRIIIRFPFGTAEKKQYDPAVEEYLEKLAERLKDTGGNVQLTGHTDNVGSPEANQKLGLERAKTIRNYLVNKGVDKSQISISSMGKSQPVATNETAEGRHDNRRVELRFISSN